MQKIDISEPTRVKVIFNTPLQGGFTVYRKRGNETLPNYFRNFPQPRPQINFNLYQKGVYLFPENCRIEFLGNIKTFSIDLPVGDRNLRIPELSEFAYKKGINMRTPARVFKEQRVIQTNELFDRLPEQVQHAILFHELGHFKYSDEIGADMFSINKIYQIGGNVSQLFYALELACSGNSFNEARKLNIINTSKKNGN